MKKYILVAIIAFAVTMIAYNNIAFASDDTITPTPTPILRVNSLVPPGNGSGGRISVKTIFDYYNETLTDDQRQIADYLIGMYNYMYMGARGFIYENINTTADLVARLKSFGNRFWGSTLEGNASRLDPYMQQFMSAVISYAGTIDVDFATWVSSLDTAGLYIPYTKYSLNSWTNYYNDPTAIGVEGFGVYNDNWVSGEYYDYKYASYPFLSETATSKYNSFILNYSPVLYTQGSDYWGEQNVISLKDKPIIDELYILRANSNNYKSYRYICSSAPEQSVTYDFIRCSFLDSYNPARINVHNLTVTFNQYIFTSESEKSLADIITFAFENSPFEGTGNTNSSFDNGKGKFWYPLIKHVYLVDDLNTFSNKQEIFNITDLEINGDNAIWIQEPESDDLYWQIEPSLVQDDEWDENIKHEDLTPVQPGDINQQIVNNTVINDYDIIAPGAIINVPVNWLNGDGNYLEYTNNTALPFFVMVADIFEALGEIRIFIIAVLILGLAGGVVVKFLL